MESRRASGMSMSIWAKLGMVTAIVAAMLTFGGGDASAAAKSVDGYKAAWSISSGKSDYDATISIVEANGDGSLLYAKHEMNQRDVLEFGMVGPSGKVLWKRNDLHAYTYEITDNAILASVYTDGQDHRSETIITIDKKTGKTKSKFLLNSIGVEYLERFSLDNERLYVSDKNKLIAVKHGGKKAWELVTHQELYKQTNIPIGYHEPVIINDDMILTWTTCSMSQMCSWLDEESYQLTALSPQTGKTIWSVPERISADYVTIDRKNGQIVMNTFDDQTVAYRLSDGKKLWSYQVKKDSSFYSGQDFGITDPDGKTYLNVIYENNGVYSTGRFIALNADGSVAWESKFNTGSIVNLRGISQDGKVLYFEGGNIQSKIYRVDRHTGKRLSEGTYHLEYAIDNGHVLLERLKDGATRATVLTSNGAKIGSVSYQNNDELVIGPDYTVYHVSLRKITAYTPQKKAVSVAVNGQFPTMPQAAVVRNGYTYVPVRGILEQSGATVRWDGAARKVTVKKTNLTVELRIDSAKAIVNGKTVQLEAPAIMIGNSTMLPLRFLVETLDGTVTWDNASKTVWINMES
ncbi:MULTISPECIES: stalk domain-containing protein [Paenibacillus]|uniref:stalk domain-containing protein n=1 Tax=Paenibacillus TaxID=44249 RepID=UPI002041DFF7|nr:stalk domain-containing protein [Paenibacillus camelliae]MCM3633477.1 stalk domain-containing protein [Paenibacillus camelliae]